jgi:[ribosomal protein S5]-alanine N-acetyltransferase
MRPFLYFYNTLLLNMINLKTPRLTICELTLDDDAFILQLLNTPSWLRYIGDRNVKDLPAARNYLLNGPMKSYRDFGFGLYKMVYNDTPIGMCGFLKRPTLAYVDIGFAVLPEYAGNGFAYEAGKAVMDYGRDVLKLTTVAAIAMDDNAASIRVLGKLGLGYIKRITLNPGDRELMLFLKEF